jgi:hypothetical protein
MRTVSSETAHYITSGWIAEEVTQQSITAVDGVVIARDAPHDNQEIIAFYDSAGTLCLIDGDDYAG